MTIIFTKKPTTPTTKLASKTSMPADVIALIDEIGDLQDDAETAMKQIRALQVKLKPYGAKMKCLAERMTSYATSQGLGPDDELTEATENFVLEVGKAGTLRRVVDIRLAMKRMGRKMFFQKVTIGLGVIDQYLTPEQQVGVIETERVLRSAKLLRRTSAEQKSATKF
ncbi:hypothetical protein [Lichenicoccus sp.]|uniref:hypothetical protein n=1 Tax=Lichenicoccus sp. TaxID=2781899 RepID=UPI003D142BAB